MAYLVPYNNSKAVTSARCEMRCKNAHVHRITDDETWRQRCFNTEALKAGRCLRDPDDHPGKRVLEHASCEVVSRGRAWVPRQGLVQCIVLMSACTPGARSPLVAGSVQHLQSQSVTR